MRDLLKYIVIGAFLMFNIAVGTHSIRKNKAGPTAIFFFGAGVQVMALIAMAVNHA